MAKGSVFMKQLCQSSTNNYFCENVLRLYCNLRYPIDIGKIKANKNNINMYHRDFYDIVITKKAVTGKCGKLGQVNTTY